MIILRLLEVKMVEKLNLEGPNWWPPDSSTLEVTGGVDT